MFCQGPEPWYAYMLLGAGSWSEYCRVTSSCWPAASVDVAVTQYTFVERWIPPGSGKTGCGLMSMDTGAWSGGVTKAPGVNEIAACPSCVNTVAGSVFPFVPTLTDWWPLSGCWLLPRNWGGGET